MDLSGRQAEDAGVGGPYAEPARQGAGGHPGQMEIGKAGGAMGTTRRTFLKYTAGSTMLTLIGFDKVPGISQALAQVPGGHSTPVELRSSSRRC